tara:strand:+ start:1155 stop:1487 length:333 start_codon:yes stop_codon:yes gene_type:complete
MQGNEKKEENKMSDWIKTKAGLQMAETIIRYIPRIFVCLEEIAKVYTFKGLDAKNGIKKDVLKLADEMDIRKQENTNLKFQIDKEEKQVAVDILTLVERVNYLETIIEER